MPINSNLYQNDMPVDCPCVSGNSTSVSQVAWWAVINLTTASSATAQCDLFPIPSVRLPCFRQLELLIEILTSFQHLSQKIKALAWHNYRLELHKVNVCQKWKQLTEGRKGWINFRGGKESFWHFWLVSGGQRAHGNFYVNYFDVFDYMFGQYASWREDIHTRICLSYNLHICTEQLWLSRTGGGVLLFFF